ncbi:craniofacial development protein 2-like [Mercenaria mercenaria]|uniref:craniofacial development protein 2-like n=1 Tax=Mercenaria mercenaria TaxID=6596 RepID=UPI001E1D64D5|nr:craniofacial development protein 2-like [Mercenaria mercenaria]
MVTSLTIGSWNVCTLMDIPNAERPARRTALVALELGRYSVDVTALSETRIAAEGQLIEYNAGYTFFWNGQKVDERREAGVGFAIRTKLVRNLTGQPKGINDRLVTIRLPVGMNKHATLISCYAPTMTNPEEIKDKFYQELDALTSRDAMLFILGDFNARVGMDCHSWEGAIGRNGVGKCNSNGVLLLRTCISHDLLITNTIFRQANRNKTAWMDPRSEHWNMIDYIITRKTSRQDVKITKTISGVECWTDHRLVISKLSPM